MNTLLVILLFLGLVFARSNEVTPGATQSQTCAASNNGEDRCSPVLLNDRYQLPADGAVLEFRVNNGPVSPDSQAGFEVTVDADGTASITETPMGASPDLSASERTAEQATRTEELGVEGLQAALADLENCGFYYLPQRDEVDSSALPDGGGIEAITVTLADGQWDVLNQALLEPADLRQLAGCTSILEQRFGVGT